MTEEQIEKLSPIFIKQYKEGTKEQREKMIDDFIELSIPFLKENLKNELEMLIKNDINSI